MKADIMLIGDNKLNSVGGEQESTKIIIEGIKEKFKTVSIQPGNEEGLAAGVVYYGLTDKTRIKHLINRPIAFLKYVRKLRKTINELEPQIIHTQAQFSLFYVSFLYKFKLINKDIILIHTERGLYSKYNKIIKSVFKCSFKNTDFIIFTTNYNKELWKPYLDKHNIYSQCKVIENTAGLNFEGSLEKKNNRVNKNLTIGFAGRYADWKNWPLAVKIVKGLYKNIGSRLHVRMAVGCLDENSILQTKLMFQELSEMLGNNFKGEINLPISKMTNFYDELDIYMLTSKKNTESFGRTLVEAMSRGVIALTTDCGGASEVVGNKDNILKDEYEFIEKALQYYEDKSMKNNEVYRGMNRVFEVYSFANNINKHINLYENILDGSYGR